VASRQWTVQIEGQDHTVEARWSQWTGGGKVYLDGEQISSWSVVFEFQRHKLKIGMLNAELRRTDGGGSGNLVKDIDLWIEGRHVQDLPLPNSLGQAQVTATHQNACPKCQTSALYLVYSTGIVEVVCPQCGRFDLG